VENVKVCKKVWFVGLKGINYLFIMVKVLIQDIV